MASKAATLLSVILFIAFALELVAVLSEPITKSITLCSYGKYNFGVFGYCNTETGDCSSVRIGYDDDISLPSSARSSLSKLLVVHVVAAALTFVLFICALLSHVFHSSGGFLLAVLILTLPAFLVSLLAFLVDILLFVSHLNWAGWLVLVSTVLIAFSGIVMCLMRRTLSSRKATKRRTQDQAELQNLSVFNSTTALNSAPGLYSGSLKEPEFTELKYETSAGTGLSGEDERIPLRSAGGIIETNDYLNTSNVSDDANNTFDSLNQQPTGYRGYEPTPLNNGRQQYNNRAANNEYSGQRQRRQKPQGLPVPPTHDTIPAGSYVPGLEQEREDGYGPNVVPVPRLRPDSPPIQPVNTDLSQMSLHDQPLPMDPKNNAPPVPDHSAVVQQQQQQQQRRPSGPRPPRSAAVNPGIQQYDRQDTGVEYVAPRSQWNDNSSQPTAAPDFAQRARSPPVPIDFSPQAYRDGAASPESSRQKLRQYFVDDNSGAQAGPQAQPLNDYQPSQGVRYNSNSFQGYATSNPDPQQLHYATASPPQNSHYGDNNSESSYGMSSTGQQPAPHYYQGYSGYSAPPKMPQQQKSLSEGLIDSNPDFKLGVPAKRGGAQRANRKKMISPHALNEGPYGFQ